MRTIRNDVRRAGWYITPAHYYLRKIEIMCIAFILTMPRVGSWNGKWTGEGNLFAKVINYTQMYGTSKTAKETAESILIKKNFSYDFGDGWATDIEVRKVTSAEARKLRKDSKGFCGYDWMIDDIINHGRICG